MSVRALALSEYRGNNNKPFLSAFEFEMDKNTHAGIFYLGDF